MKRKADLTNLPKEKVIQLYRMALMTGIPLANVHQKVSHLTTKAFMADDTQKKEDHAKKMQATPLHKRIFFTLLPLSFVAIGLLLVGSAVWPLFSYYVFTPGDLSQVSLLAPIPKTQVLDVMPRVIVQAQGETQNKTYVAPTILSDDLDYTNLSNWFPNLALPNVDESKAHEYTLDIPAVNIFSAKVRLGGSNLDKSLIQYPGTAMPGDLGDPVIFGHSILRQFYNPSEKNPNRYLSIFSTIMTLKKGDKIFLTEGNIKYTYEVVEKRVVHPQDTYILEQQYAERELKLVTCVPEGTIQDRGVIIARITKGE